MTDKTYTFPERSEMLKRLVNMCDDQDLVDLYYPVLLESAGVKTNLDGFVARLVLATSNYPTIPSKLEALQKVYDHNIIGLLTQNAELAEEAKKMFKFFLRAT